MVHIPGFRDILNRFHSSAANNHLEEYSHHHHSHHSHHHHHHHHHSRSSSRSRTPAPPAPLPATAHIVTPARPRSTPPVRETFPHQKHHGHIPPIYVTPSPLLDSTIPITNDVYPMPVNYIYPVNQSNRTRVNSYSGSGRRSLDHASVGASSLHPDPSSSSSFNTSSHSHSHSHSHSLSSGSLHHASRGSSSTSISQTRPALKRSNTGAGNSSQGHGSHSSSDQDIQKRRRHVSFVNPKRLVTLHMHPLLASNAHTHAPISYDVTCPPSKESIVDRTTRSSVPGHLLKEPATEPSTIDRLVLKSEWLPAEWGTVAFPGSGTMDEIQSHHGYGKKFFIGESSGSSGGSITNFDVLYAIYANLQQKITQEEWEELGRSDSRGQRHAIRAYDRRCRMLGRGWEEGLKRVDWLGERTCLSGVLVDKSENPLGMASLVFSRSN
ncbi:hypothetical protein VKT23_012007 [Stygiomarasmius scandens]|uniref:DUF6699 domain-containing protein n=1 Tax=Marasmiellus scandens TaxID=2682957 RepID=A0ABR1J8E3_9AGAR